MRSQINIAINFPNYLKKHQHKKSLTHNLRLNLENDDVPFQGGFELEHHLQLKQS
jgi:hypothetical protein